VCLYSPGAKRWTMTERAARHVRRAAHEFVIGPSVMVWQRDALLVEIDERGAPLPRTVRGRLRLRPEALSNFSVALDGMGRHRWSPLAPCARIEVDLAAPRLRWQGSAYLDSNESDEPIERGFTRWDWQRATLPDGQVAVIYDTQPRDAAPRVIASRFAPDGSHRAIETPASCALPPAPLWRIARRAHADGAARVLRTLEDTPFYTRSLLDLSLDGRTVSAVHETLDVRRLSSPIVQAMLPFRMPRRA
jgi:carotenoid 1,2-hydratase